MKQKKLSLDDIISSESDASIVTHNTLQGFFANISPALNVLLHLMYFTGRDKDVNTQEGLFHSYCWHQYIQAPYSFRTVIILFERGHYREAIIIVRSLYESFIQIRYLDQNRDKIDSVWSAGKIRKEKEGKISFKVMFDKISPGFYEKYYGEQLSGITHSKSISDIFRIERKSATEGRTIIIPEYNQVWAGYIVNNLIALLFGYLNFFPLFFPDGFGSIDINLSKEYIKSTAWLRTYLGQNRKTFPKALDWYMYIDKITKPSNSLNCNK